MPDTPPPKDVKPRCTTCPRVSPIPICTVCRDRAAGQLDELPGLLADLDQHLAAGGGGLGEYVSGGSFSSRLPANVNALTLVAVTPQALAGRIADPVAPLDANGESIPLWTTAWAAVWRRYYGHHQPVQVRRQRWNPHAPAPLPPQWMWQADPVDRARQLAVLMDERAQVAKRGGRVLLALPRPAGPVEEAWAARFGTVRHAHRFEVDHAYLSTWLAKSCDEFPQATRFVVGLRALAGAARAVVGAPPEVFYLGQCPEPVAGSDPTTYCGAKIWHDPKVGRVVVCPACRTNTPEDRYWNLAARIQSVWGKTGDREVWTT